MGRCEKYGVWRRFSLWAVRIGCRVQKHRGLHPGELYVPGYADIDLGTRVSVLGYFVVAAGAHLGTGSFTETAQSGATFFSGERTTL